MSHEKLAEFFKTQKSLTEWLEDIGHKDVEAMRHEDNEKRERLKVLADLIGLPFDRPVQFEASELNDNSKVFNTYLNEHGNELCALRLIPKSKDLPKLRMRGKSIKDAYEWFKKQDIDAAKYRADFVLHEDVTTWSVIFVINKTGIFGEIIQGGHHQLTQGIHQEDTPRTFLFDFRKWTMVPNDKTAIAHLKKVTSFLRVKDPAVQKKLAKQFRATFSNNYLEGYFESTDSPEFDIIFKDYSPLLGKLYENVQMKLPANNNSVVSGLIGSPGKAEGPVRIISPDAVEDDFPEGAVLVCEVTTPNYVPLMQKAVAIVTDQGGILSHAAIVARELKRPCIVGTINATKILKDGQIVSVDADLGVVTIS